MAVPGSSPNAETHTRDAPPSANTASPHLRSPQRLRRPAEATFFSLTHSKFNFPSASTPSGSRHPSTPSAGRYHDSESMRLRLPSPHHLRDNPDDCGCRALHAIPSTARIGDASRKFEAAFADSSLATYRIRAIYKKHTAKHKNSRMRPPQPAAPSNSASDAETRTTT